MGFGGGINSSMMWDAAPFLAVPTAGVIIQSRSKDNGFFEVVGKILQMIPATVCVYFWIGDKIEHKLFWYGISESPYSTTQYYSTPEGKAWWESVGTPREREAFSDYWAPKITIPLTVVTLLSPLIIKGMKRVAENYRLSKVVTLLGYIEKGSMIVIKTGTVGLNLIGIYIVAHVSSPSLVVTYSGLLLANLYHTILR